MMIQQIDSFLLMYHHCDEDMGLTQRESQVVSELLMHVAPYESIHRSCFYCNLMTLNC